MAVGFPGEGASLHQLSAEMINRSERLTMESKRLHLQFLRSQLKLIYTIATFPDLNRSSDRLHQRSRSIAWNHYREVLRMLPNHSPAAQDELQSELERVRAVLEGSGNGENGEPEAAITPQVAIEARPVLNGLNNGNNGHCASVLTAREIEVLTCIAEGYSTKQVAGILGVSFKTAACHRQHIMNKLGIHETAGLVRYAIREGIADA